MAEVNLKQIGIMGDKVKVPEGIVYPNSIDKTLAVCRRIFDHVRVSEDHWVLLRPATSGKPKLAVETLVPPEYKDFVRWLEHVYGRQYETGQSYTLDNPYAEAVFQQLQIKLDQEKGRFRVNHVGLYAPTYVDALGTARYSFFRDFIHEEQKTGAFQVEVDNRHLGRGHFAEEKDFKAILLGCSSLSSAAEFKRMVKGMNPKAMDLILDKDPLAIALARNVEVEATQVDVLNFDKEVLGQSDLVATNFLLTSLPEEERMEAYRKLLTTWKPLIYPRTGRLVLVEQLNKKEIDELVNIAFDCGYEFSGDHNPRTGWGKNRKAVRYTSSDEIDSSIDDLSQALQSDRIYSGGYYSDEVKGTVVDEAQVFILVPKGELGQYVNDV